MIKDRTLFFWLVCGIPSLLAGVLLAKTVYADEYPLEDYRALSPGFHVLVGDMRSPALEVPCERVGNILVARSDSDYSVITTWDPETPYLGFDLSQTRQEMDAMILGQMGFMSGWHIAGRIECEAIAALMYAELGTLVPSTELMLYAEYHIDFGDWLVDLMEVPSDSSEVDTRLVLYEDHAPGNPELVIAGDRNPDDGAVVDGVVLEAVTDAESTDT